VKLRIAFPIVTILLSIALAACGIGVNAAKPSPTADPQKAMLAFAQCMRDHGVNLPDPGPTSGPVQLNDVDPTTMDAAQKACQSKLKGQNVKTPSAAEQARMRDALLKFSACMRAHGINLPDPQFNGNGATLRVGPDAGIDPNSAEYQAAQKACEKNLPNGGKGLSTSRGGSGGSGPQTQVGGN
jgi:hypothetical protein